MENLQKKGKKIIQISTCFLTFGKQIVFHIQFFVKSAKFGSYQKYGKTTFSKHQKIWKSSKNWFPQKPEKFTFAKQQNLERCLSILKIWTNCFANKI